jgi:RimJ/RimL family protein N-acetyltransferase
MANWIRHPLILQGKKVILAPLQEEHFAALIEAAQDKRIWEYFPYDWHQKKNLSEVFKEAVDQREKGLQYPFAVIDKKTRKIVGSTRYLRLSQEFRTLEIGWTWYVPEYWQTGYNRECKLLLLTHCFEEMKAIRVQFATLDTNLRSRKAIEGIGAKYERLNRNVITWAGKKRNAVVYSIIDDEWPEAKKMLSGHSK